MNLIAKLPIAAALGLGVLATSPGSGFAQSYRSDRDYSAEPPYASEVPAGQEPSWTAASKPAAPPSEIVGSSVVDFKGKPIGHVTQVAGDQVVVRYDTYLGMPNGTGVFPWQQLNPAYGNIALLTTNLSKRQMEGLPAQPS